MMKQIAKPQQVSRISHKLYKVRVEFRTVGPQSFFCLPSGRMELETICMLQRPSTLVPENKMHRNFSSPNLYLRNRFGITIDLGESISVLEVKWQFGLTHFHLQLCLPDRVHRS